MLIFFYQCFAPPGEETLKALRDLHPVVPPPSTLPHPTPKVPFFQEDLILTALASFGAGSGAGLFAYRPHILQQCAQADSESFLRALCVVVNLFATGEAPSFLRPFLAGGSQLPSPRLRGAFVPSLVVTPFVV